jgi:hypothetical protein
MTPTPLDNMPQRVQEGAYRLIRVSSESVMDVAMWMTEDSLGEPGAGAWATETDLYGVILPIAERLWWLRLKYHETWLLRGGR